MSWNTGLARIGAVLYVLWGLVHYNAAYGVHQLAQGTPLTIEHGRLEQLAFYLASFATAGIVLAALNWRNSPVGFWCNAIVIGIGDIPFILFVLVPGYVPVWPGIEGPVLWVAALACTAIAQVPMSGTVGGRNSQGENADHGGAVRELHGAPPSASCPSCDVSRASR
jgi:hypothetical protein